MKNPAYLFVLSVFASNVNAAIIWDWSFGSNAGQFITDGTTTGGTATAGAYSVTDFSVTSSGAGATIGSWYDGEYSAAGFSSTAPYSLVWDGSSVSNWLTAGSNSHNWLVFDDVSNSNYFFFGWETGNLNTINQAAYYPANNQSSLLSVGVANSVAVPEPGSLVLLALGLVGLGFLRVKGTF